MAAGLHQGLDFLSSADPNGAQTQALLTLAADMGRTAQPTPRWQGAGADFLGLHPRPGELRRGDGAPGGQTIDLNPSVSQVGRVNRLKTPLAS